MSVRRALLAVPLAAVALLGAPAAPGVALSCVPPDTLLAHAERAFIGTLVARDGDRLTFAVAEAFGGELPDPLVVRDDLPFPWRVSAPPDTEIGLVVYERNGELLVNPCTVVPPASLREALPPGTVRPAPPPPPDPVPPAPPEPLLRPLQQRLATTDASASVRAGWPMCRDPHAARARRRAARARSRGPGCADGHACRAADDCGAAPGGTARSVGRPPGRTPRAGAAAGRTSADAGARARLGRGHAGAPFADKERSENE